MERVRDGIYQVWIKAGQRKVIKKLFFDLREETGEVNAKILIDALKMYSERVSE